MARFVREFNTESRAISFAKTVGGIVNARYDWDNTTNRIIKYWVVRY